MIDTNGPFLWYATRSTGIVAFALLTLTTTLGVAATRRALASRWWPRFATQALHRNLSLLAMAFLAVHIVTTLLDSFVTVSWWSAVLPFASSYRPVWVSFGTVAFDILLAVTITSLLRLRMTARTWQAVHLASYAAWPMALIHFLFTGTDGGRHHWGTVLALACALPVAAAAGFRLTAEPQAERPVRSLAGRSR